MAEFKLIIFPVEERALREAISHPLGAQALNRQNNVTFLEEYREELKRKRQRESKRRLIPNLWSRRKSPRIDFVREYNKREPLDFRFIRWTLKARRHKNPYLSFLHVPESIVDARLFFTGNRNDWNSKPKI